MGILARRVVEAQFLATRTGKRVRLKLETELPKIAARWPFLRSVGLFSDLNDEINHVRRIVELKLRFRQCLWKPVRLI